jgi:hypothetical protein
MVAIYMSFVVRKDPRTKKVVPIRAGVVPQRAPKLSPREVTLIQQLRRLSWRNRALIEGIAAERLTVQHRAAREGIQALVRLVRGGA